MSFFLSTANSQPLIANSPLSFLSSERPPTLAGVIGQEDQAFATHQHALTAVCEGQTVDPGVDPTRGFGRLPIAPTVHRGKDQTISADRHQPAVLSSRGDVVEMQVRHVGFLSFAGNPPPLLPTVVGNSEGTARTDGQAVVLVNKADAEESGQGHDVFVAALLDQ